MRNLQNVYPEPGKCALQPLLGLRLTVTAEQLSDPVGADQEHQARVVRHRALLPLLVPVVAAGHRTIRTDHLPRERADPPDLAVHRHPDRDAGRSRPTTYLVGTIGRFR